MLLRLDALEDIGRFARLKHNAQQFTELTLIFGRNGYGKSTICAVLRSLSEGDPAHITTRRRLQSSKAPRIQTSWHPPQTVAFGSGKWNARPGVVHIFDQEFVNRNLHVGDSVTRENKRSILPVVLGTEGVVLAQKIVELDREQRDLDTAMKQDALLIRTKCPVLTVEQILPFCEKEPPQDIDDHVTNAERGVQLARQSVAVQNKRTLEPIELIELASFKEVCGRTLASVSGDITKQVRDHVQTHALRPPLGERWLRYGLEHISGNHCPFCAQSLDSITLIDAFSSYFSEAFNRLLADRDAAILSLEKFTKSDGIRSLIDTNAMDVLFWKEVCELKRPPSMSEQTLQSVNVGLQALHQLLERKLANPLSVVTFDDSAGTIEAAFASIHDYNEEVNACRAAIDAAKQEANKADLAKAERSRDSWVALAAKRADPLKGASVSYSAASKRRLAIEGEKKTAQVRLTDFAKSIMASRQTAINDLLSDFGASFRIVDAKANFKGREPNTEFAIGIGSVKVPAGEVSFTDPCFKTVLSTGDKTTLALAFFITQIREDPNIEDSIVVFDDPFHSQDMHRQFETTSHIRAIADKARQTIVFSHDPRFLYSIEKDADRARTKTFQLSCTDTGDGQINLWSSEDELKSLYIRQSEVIREFASHGKLLHGNSYNSVHQAMRPFLEDYLKARFPGRFAASDQISRMAEAIRDAGPDDPMFEHVEVLFTLNEYTRVNMHGGAAESDPVALRAQAKKVVRIVGSY